MFYNEHSGGPNRGRMDRQGWMIWNISSYCLLFLLSFLVFDSVTVMIGVFAALAALYHFTTKGMRNNRF